MNTIAKIAIILLLVLALCGPARPEEAPGPNVLFIIVDALRPDHLGCYGYVRPTSPVIDDLSAQGVLFETAIAQAPWTKGSLSSMFTSLYPFQHGATNWAAVLADSFVTLPEILSRSGYSTLSVINMVGMAGRFGVLQGFDSVSAGDKYERNAVQTTDDAIDLIRDATLPFFMVVHYYDVHAPYRPPLKYVDKVASRSDLNRYISSGSGRQVGSEDTEHRMLLSYDGCIRYVDESVGRLLGFLEDAGIGDDTIIILTADHGEAHGEHGVYGHGAEAYDDAIKVPLIIKIPGRHTKPGRVAAQVRHVDLLPTILELCRIEDVRAREGVSLLSLTETGKREVRQGGFFPDFMAFTDCTNRRVPGKMALRSQGWKLVTDPVTSLLELYDLKEDPGELRNIWGSGVAMGDSLLRLLQRIPSVSTPGWRVAFVGGTESHTFKGRVTVAGGGRLRQVGESARIHRNLRVEVSDDSVSLDIESTVGGPHFILFDTQPEDAQVSFTVSSATTGGPDSVRVGRALRRPADTRMTLTRREAHGIADAFAAHLPEDGPRVYIWWLPGVRTGKPVRAELTPEERKRLKALGYIQ
jgi:choline-sulfatase